MNDREALIEKIESAFADSEHPGGRFLQGSFEGCEEVGPFEDKQDWRGIEADFLDDHAAALSFFSEAGFRFYLPAYLIADLHGERLLKGGAKESSSPGYLDPCSRTRAGEVS